MKVCLKQHLTSEAIIKPQVPKKPSRHDFCPFLQLHAFWYIGINFKNKMKNQDHSLYWKKNIQYVSILLAIWFICSYGLGIIFVEQMNTIKIGGFPLGFWMAQQGAIYIFVILIFIYVYLMNRLDKEFGVEEE